MSRLVLLLVWLAVLSCSSDPPISSQKPEVYPAAKVASAADRAALVAFYRATGGNGWDRKDNWLSDAPLSSWHGVETNAQGRVIQLRILQNNLRGSLPSQLAYMDQLEKLIVVNNVQLTGFLPSSLGSLKNLKTLRIAGNGIAGSIPSSLGNLENLQELGLQENRLTGSIPSSLGNLSNLEHLWLSDNRLSGAIPSSLNNLDDLWSVYISGNQLAGCLPFAWRSFESTLWSNDLYKTGLDFCSEQDDSPPARDPKEAFNIELVFVDSTSTRLRPLVQQAAARLERVILSDLPDVNFQRWIHNEYNSNLRRRIRVEHVVDDLLVFVGNRDLGFRVAASTGVILIRSRGKLPVVATLALNVEGLADNSQEEVYSTILHELAHAAGFGMVWEDLELINGYRTPYFTGPTARALFATLGGSRLSEAIQPVPVDQSDRGHWRGTIFWDELMAKNWYYPFAKPLSAITIAQFADLGYQVDYSEADEYSVPRRGAAKPRPVEPPSLSHHHPPQDLVLQVDEEGRVVR